MGTYFPIKFKKSYGRSTFSTLQSKRVLPSDASLSIKTLYAIESGGILFLDLLYPPRPDNLNKRNYLKRKVIGFEKEGLIIWSEKGGKRVPSLTVAGKKKLREQLSRFPTKSVHWDGKWRIVIFDIWERRRRIRDLLRLELTRYGFKKIQNSVWAYPYDCQEFIDLLKTDMRLGRGVLFLVVEKLEGDQNLRTFFDL